MCCKKFAVTDLKSARRTASEFTIHITTSLMNISVEENLPWVGEGFLYPLTPREERKLKVTRAFKVNLNHLIS